MQRCSGSRQQQYVCTDLMWIKNTKQATFIDGEAPDTNSDGINIYCSADEESVNDNDDYRNGYDNNLMAFLTL